MALLSNLPAVPLPIGPPTQVTAPPAQPTSVPVYMASGNAALPMSAATQMPGPNVSSKYSTYPFANRNYEQELSQSLEHFMNPNSDYIQNARRRGMEVAATRGGINSSIAAGAAERSALDAAIPLAQSSMASRLGQEQALLQDWASQQGFNRDMAAMPFTNSMEMLKGFTAASMADPQLYSPEVVSGYTNFFNRTMQDMMERYFGGS